MFVCATKGCGMNIKVPARTSLQHGSHAVHGPVQGHDHACAGVIAINPDGLDRLMPMHMIVSASGVLRHLGPTLHKLSGLHDYTGHLLFDVFEVLRPRDADCTADLARAEMGQIKLRLRGDIKTQLKGLVTKLNEGDDLLINFSFGYGIVEAVQNHNLTCSDFPTTDLTVEMLYLIEAKSVAQVAQKKLNLKLQSAKQRAEQQALTDALTGLSNRRALDYQLDKMLREQTNFALMHIDLDFFKAVNDTLGHAAGDHVLTRVASILRCETRSSDVVARVGGDEFTILLHRFLDPGFLMEASKRIISRLQEPIPFKDDVCQISGSIGITISSFYETPNAEQMLHDADIALYASKHKGRACASIYSAALEAFVEQRGLSGRID
jgi:diguanylate cyclase (GGDEF)-like protein